MQKNARIEGYYGGRGQGKSTGVKARIAKEPRVIVFDPMREYGRLRGWYRATSLRHVQNAMIEGKGRAYKIAYTPPVADYPQALHELCGFLFAAQKPYHEERSQQQIVLVIEEMNLSAPSSALPKHQQGFYRAVLQGRHYGINIIGVTQRPKTIAPIFRDNADCEVVYKLDCPDSVAYVEKKLPPEKRGAIYTLKPHEFLKIENFSAEKGKNRISKTL